MPDDPYTLTDLARLADVTPRTIRYYVAQGLLPAPDVAGPATRYTEGHLGRLRLIRRLQREHLPLAEIRARLERMGDDDVQAALAATEPAPSGLPQEPGETTAYVRELMAKAGVEPRFHDRPSRSLLRRVEAAAPAPASQPPDAARRQAELPAWEPAGAAFERPFPDAFPIRETPGPSPAPPATPWAPTPGTLVVPPVPRSPGDRSTWERISLGQDVELHVRRPLDRRANKLVERLVRIARELFEDEP